MPTTITEDRDRERLIRLEEQIKHMSTNLTEGLHEIKSAMEKLVSANASDRKDDRERINALEKRVDKLYVLGSAALFIGTPAVSIIIKVIFAKFGF